MSDEAIVKQSKEYPNLERVSYTSEIVPRLNAQLGAVGDYSSFSMPMWVAFYRDSLILEAGIDHRTRRRFIMRSHVRDRTFNNPCFCQFILRAYLTQHIRA
jgi:hypothetical protein